MPELPEVETIRRQLEPVLVGQVIEWVDVLHTKSWEGDVESMVGMRVDAVERKGKMLMLNFTSSIPGCVAGATRSRDLWLVVHLKMTGQLIYELSVVGSQHSVKNQTQNQKLKTDNRIVGGHPTNAWFGNLPDKHTRVILKFNKGTLFFNDQRLFGWMRLVDQLSVNRLISTLPPDIVDTECDGEHFYKVLQRSGRPVKVVVMDSSLVGGVGNIYANDGLFDAGIDPRRPAKSLTRAESERLLFSLKKVMNLGIELGGATAGDGKFVNTQGVGGLYQERFLVYEQEGKTVEKDGVKGVVQKFKLGGRGTYWVAEVQK